MWELPADGYQVESVTTVPDTISIAGTDEALETLKQNDNTHLDWRLRTLILPERLLILKRKSV